MLRFFKWFLISLLSIILVLVIIYLLGPKSQKPEFVSTVNVPQIEISALNDYISQNEKLVGEIKEDNQARIIWQDSIPQKTAYSLVYLHGFGASQGEGEPVHKNIADSLHANLYLTRLKGHGLVKKDAFVGLTPESYMESAVDALGIGKLIGDQIILMATSTGGSQALYLAAKFPDQIAAVVLYSPFIEMADEQVQMLSVGPWHEAISEMMLGTDVTYTKRADSVAAYWSEYYHLDAYKSLFSMVHFSTTPEIVSQIETPVFMAYYYKDEEHQDDVVSVAAMEEMFEILPSKIKKKLAFPLTGNHVIASRWRSHDWKAVQDSSWQFLKTNLKL